MAPFSQHRVDARRSSAWLALLGLALAGCAATTGENAGSCQDDVDGDGDELVGCKDSDCHRFEVCRQHAAALTPDGGTAGSGGRSGSGGSVQPTGGTGGRMMSGGMDGSVEDDAGPDHDASTCACTAGETCTDAGCMLIDEPEPTYTIQMVSAESPSGTFGPPPDGTCVEIACRSGGGSPFSYCPCEPELYVRVIHIADPSAPDPVESVVLSTQIQGEGLEVMFDSSERADVALELGDKLRFELWDQNMTVADSEIYRCEPELGELAPGELKCTALSGASGLEEFSIVATLEKH